MARRHDYEPIGETSVTEAESEVYGGLYQGGVDAENPFGNEGVRVVRRMRVASSTESDPARQRFLWWVLGPAITLLLVMAVSVGVVYQNNSANSVATRGGLDMPTLGAPQGPAPLTAALDAGTAAALGDTIEAPEPVADDDASAVDPVVDDADADDTKPAPKMNATAVLSCLEDKCQPLVTQLGKTWRELANINLLRCLASAAFNKTAAAVCFKSAGPSELRDTLVACAGCNKCIKLSDQASVDRACAKYEAWAEKKRAEADAADADTDVDADADATADSGATPEMLDEGGVLVEAPDETGPGPLASGLPNELKSKLCSQHWCP